MLNTAVNRRASGLARSEVASSQFVCRVADVSARSTDLDDALVEVLVALGIVDPLRGATQAMREKSAGR